MVAIIVKPIIPKEKVVVDTKRMENAIKKAVDEIVRNFEADWNDVVGTWRDKPDFEKEVGYRGNDYVGESYTTNEIILYLNRGTKERWAAMDYRFKAKTSTSGPLASGPGAYPRPILKGKQQFMRVAASRRARGLPPKYDKPKKGVEARNFDRRIIRNNKARAFRLLRNAFSKGVR